jgi:magnesium transporter
MMSMAINSAVYHRGRRVAEIDLEQAQTTNTGQGRFVWIGSEPDEALLRTVQRRFGLHDLAVEDAHSGHQRPKLEIYGNSLFIVLRTAQLQDSKIQFRETHIFGDSGYVVTVRHGSTTGYREVRARCESAPKMLCMGESFVVYPIMDFVVYNFFAIVHEFESEVDAVEGAIFSEAASQADVPRIYQYVTICCSCGARSFAGETRRPSNVGPSVCEVSHVRHESIVLLAPICTSVADEVIA